MKKIKVLQVIPSFEIGGAEKVVLDYLTYFDRNTVEIKAISMYGNHNSIYDSFIKENGLDVVYLNKKPGLDLSMVMKIKKIVKEFKPDIIHSHMNTMKYIICSVINNKKVKMFHTIHSEPEKDAGKVDKFSNKIAFKYFNCIPITLTDKLACDTNLFYGLNNSIVINNGVDIEKFRNIKDTKEDIRNRLNLTTDSFIIGHVGRFSRSKNHEFIIDIYKKFVEIEKNSYLVLVGDGELKHDIKQKVERLGLADNVKFLGVRKDIPEIVKAMDVFLFPSHYEGFPLTLIEAQSSGIRCVISNQIDKKAILSESTVSLGLNDTIEEWYKAIKNISVKGKPSGSIKDYDIINIVKILEEYYRG